MIYSYQLALGDGHRPGYGFRSGRNRGSDAQRVSISPQLHTGKAGRSDGSGCWVKNASVGRCRMATRECKYPGPVDNT
ncbi:MAG: hypothetical protein C5S48_00795 [Candidatus Methanogaster sp.]|nr:MAG: hypothetical protein C5S48_00795 [ANME-2 cluster archaeon]